MGLTALLSKPFASLVASQTAHWKRHAVFYQTRTLKQILFRARDTVYGMEHGLGGVSGYNDFKKRVPIRDYEALKPYVDRVLAGESDILWPGKPIYLATTSGTTSGTKYIPITQASMPNHIHSARNALLLYIHRSKNIHFLDGKMLFLSGSPVLQTLSGIPAGRLSGIVNHHIPAYLRTHHVPSLQVNSIDHWENKLDAILAEVKGKKITLLSGIPPWIQMFLDKALALTEFDPETLFSDLSLYVHGGVQYTPYKAGIENSLQKKIDTLETYPASEGFIAYQDEDATDGLLLNVASGIFFEFIYSANGEYASGERVSLQDVELDKNYALIINSNAGLWGYLLGDTVKFVSKDPYKIVVTGRIRHFISAFGEHVIAEEVEQSLMEAVATEGGRIVEFTVAPMIGAGSGAGASFHEWFIEFADLPADVPRFERVLNDALQKRNAYYRDLIQGNILQPLKITRVTRGGFNAYMDSKGKLGGQNKMGRLSNDRMIAEALMPYTLPTANS